MKHHADEAEVRRWFAYDPECNIGILCGTPFTAGGRRGYLVVGGRDPRYQAFTQIHALLNQNGIPCEMEDHPDMGHEFPKDFEQSIIQAMKFLLA